MTPRSWENWAARAESRGYKTLAPSWPGLEGEVEALNADSTPLTKLDVLKIVGHYEQIIRGLDSQPIIVGHSLGGTIMQLLIDRGLGAGGIGVSPGTVRGIPDLPLSTLKSSRPVLLNPFNRGNATPLNAEQFHYAFGNTLSREESDEIYRRYHVPAANRVLFQVANANINFRTPSGSTGSEPTALRCSSSAPPRITSSPRRSSRRWPRSTRRRSSTRSSRTGRTSPEGPVGKKWWTTR